MIAVRDNYHFFIPEEYFLWEEQQLEKYELIDGQVYPLFRGSNIHSRIAVKLTALLDNHLEDASYIIGNSDLRVNILGTNDYTYPDASVSCDDRDKTTSQYITYPCLVVEVLSESTEAYDRGQKFRRYRQNPMLIDYLLVSSTSIAVDLYHKNEAGDWLILNYQAGDTIALKSIDLHFPIEQIYRGLDLAPASPTIAES